MREGSDAELDRSAAPEKKRDLTEAAFDVLRSALSGPREPNETALKLPEEYAAMPPEMVDHWADGGTTDESVDVPDRLPKEVGSSARLWVVTGRHVMHAGKTCEFGRSRPRHELKHTNLTGGGAAFAGGELMILDDHTVVVNGDSGRYGPRDEREMNAVLRAFRDSGHRVYTTGYDTDSGRPTPLIGYKLERVS